MCKDDNKNKNKKGGWFMKSVLSLNDYKKDNKQHSFLNMFLNSKKREETYNYYDSVYNESEDGKEIFKIMSRRRKNKR